MQKPLLTILGFYAMNQKMAPIKATFDIDTPEDKNKKFLLEFLYSEYKNTNDRLAGYSEADQKIIAVAATVIVGALGFTIAKIDPGSIKALPYIFFLAAGLINLAVLQSVLYSSLALFALERKAKLTVRIEQLLGVKSSDSILSSMAFNLKYGRSYKVSVLPYYLFKSFAGLILFSFIYNYDRPQFSDRLYWAAYATSLISSIVSFGVVWFNAYEQNLFKNEFLANYKSQTQLALEPK